jgi:hypothetical protein
VDPQSVQSGAVVVRFDLPLAVAFSTGFALSIVAFLCFAGAGVLVALFPAEPSRAVAAATGGAAAAALDALRR